MGDFDWNIILSQLAILPDLLLSVILGFAIGFERKLRFKEAGIRTHTIVCAGSALMMIISKHAFAGDQADAARIAAQIVSGVGFLGAGMIVYRRNQVRGLTTAAGVWATAGVGMACGGGLYVVALGAAIIIIAAQCTFHLPLKLFRSKKYFSIKVEFVQESGAGEKVQEIFGVKRFEHFSIKRSGDGIVCKAVLNTDREVTSDKLDVIMKENPFILLVERNENE